MKRIKRAWFDYLEMASSTLGLSGKMYLYTKAKKGTETYVNLIAVYLAMATIGTALIVLVYLWSPIVCVAILWIGHYTGMHQQALAYMLGEDGTRYKEKLEAGKNSPHRRTLVPPMKPASDD